MRYPRAAMKMARRDAYRNSGKNNQVSYASGATVNFDGCSTLLVIGLIVLFFIIVLSSCS